MIDLAVKTINSQKVGYTFEGYTITLSMDQSVTEVPSLVEALARIGKPLAKFAGRAFRAVTQVEVAQPRRAKA